MDAVKRELLIAEAVAQSQTPKTCYHEALHIFYSRQLGFEPRVSGPSLFWNERGQLWLRHAAVEFLPDKMQMEEDPVAVAKTFLGPAILGFDEVDGDFHNFTVWYARRFPESTASEEKLFLGQVMDSVRADIKDLNFQTALQAIAAGVREVLKTLAIPPEHRAEDISRIVNGLRG